MARVKVCAKCRKPWKREGLVSFDATCLGCGAYLHVCMNCAHYDVLSAAGCRNRDGEPGSTVYSKNFCEAFIFRESLELKGETRKLDRRSAEQKWKDLFR